MKGKYNMKGITVTARTSASNQYVVTFQDQSDFTDIKRN